MTSLYSLRCSLFALLCCGFMACESPSSNAGKDTVGADADSTAETPAFRLNQQGDSALHAGDFQAAIALYHMSMDSAAADADSFPYYDSRLDLACVHDRLNELPKAIEIAEPVLEAFIRSGDSARVGRTYATLAAFYGRAGMQEKMLSAAKSGLDILRTHGSLIERCAAYNQMAFTFSDAGQWANALPLLDSALLLMRASGVLDQLPAIYLNIGNCHRKLGHWAEARHYFQDAERGADSLGQAFVRSKALERLSQVAEATADPVQALALYRQSMALKDSMFTAEKTRNIQELEINYGTREKEMAINLLQSEQKAEVARRNLVLALWGISILVAGMLLFRWRERMRHLQVSLSENQQRLHEFARLLLDKNTRLRELEETFYSINDTPADSARTAPETMSVAGGNQPDYVDPDLYNSRILTDSDWEIFKNYFERGNPGYLQRLRTTFPNLSSAEERLFLLIKLNFKSNEAAATLGISRESIKKGRQRLRRRLGLPAEEDLELFVQKF